MASRKRYRYTFEVVFSSEEQKASFSERVESVRRKLEGREGVKMNNFDLLSRLFAMVEAETGVVSRESQPERLMNMGAAVLDVETYSPSEESFIIEDFIYRYAEDYARCRDTFWIESFNHQLLTYLPKHVHFGDRTFAMRMDLALLDWNENVAREATSARVVVDLRRPDRRTPMKALVAKTFHFVDRVWITYLRGMPDIRVGSEEDGVTFQLPEEYTEEIMEDGDEDELIG